MNEAIEKMAEYLEVHYCEGRRPCPRCQENARDLLSLLKLTDIRLDIDQSFPIWEKLYQSVRDNLSIPSYIYDFMQKYQESIRNAGFKKVKK